MSDFIEVQPIDIAPYGFQQTDYRLPGDAQALTFEELLCEVGLQRSVALEAALADLVTAIQLRREKIEQVGWATAFCSERLVEQLGPDSKNSTMVYDAGFDDVVALLTTYDIPDATTFHYDEDRGCYGISVGDLRLQYEELAFSIERENSELEKALVDLQSLVSKRDSSFEQAATFRQKISDTRTITLRNL